MSYVFDCIKKQSPMEIYDIKFYNWFIFLLGGYYHGKLVFPRDFPFKPPKIIMITPSGRFKTNTR